MMAKPIRALELHYRMIQVEDKRAFTPPLRHCWFYHPLTMSEVRDTPAAINIKVTIVRRTIN